jgi:hypothetical protein
VTGKIDFELSAETLGVIARLDRAIQYPQRGGYWIARSSRAMTA